MALNTFFLDTCQYKTRFCKKVSSGPNFSLNATKNDLNKTSYAPAEHWGKKSEQEPKAPCGIRKKYILPLTA